MSMFDPSKVKAVRSVTLPHFKLEKDVIRYFKFVSAVSQSQPTASRRPLSDEQKAALAAAESAGVAGGKSKMAPPEVAQVIDLVTGEKGQIIVNAVLASTLDQEYPGESYVGKCFSIVKYEIQGKSYAGFTVTEIDIETGGETEVETAQAGKRK